MVADAKSDQGLKVQIIEIGKDLRSQYRAETGDFDAKPPLNYTHADATISEATHQRMQDDIQNAQNFGLYSPTRQELRDWCAATMKTGDPQLENQIIAIGSQLKDTYAQESEGIAGLPGRDTFSRSLISDINFSNE